MKVTDGNDHSIADTNIHCCFDAVEGDGAIFEDEIQGWSLRVEDEKVSHHPLRGKSRKSYSSEFYIGTTLSLPFSGKMQYSSRFARLRIAARNGGA